MCMFSCCRCEWESFARQRNDGFTQNMFTLAPNEKPHRIRGNTHTHTVIFNFRWLFFFFFCSLIKRLMCADENARFCLGRFLNQSYVRSIAHNSDREHFERTNEFHNRRVVNGHTNLSHTYKSIELILQRILTGKIKCVHFTFKIDSIRCRPVSKNEFYFHSLSL